MGPRLALAFFFFLTGIFCYAATPPNAGVTPGSLCTPQDPSFQGYDYPEHVARCKRDVSDSEKAQVAASYGNIPKAQWSNYEFDHLIPLCAGGSNAVANLWPQPLDQAKKKDVVEDEVCAGMRAGTMTQAEAMTKMTAWFAANSPYLNCDVSDNHFDSACPGDQNKE